MNIGSQEPSLRTQNVFVGRQIVDLGGIHLLFKLIALSAIWALPSQCNARVRHDDRRLDSKPVCYSARSGCLLGNSAVYQGDGGST